MNTKKMLIVGKLKGTKQINNKSELKLLDGKTDRIDYRKRVTNK